jgi:hypothetical protein
MNTKLALVAGALFALAMAAVGPAAADPQTFRIIDATHLGL